MSAGFSHRSHRISREEKRRRRFWRGIAVAAGLLLIAAAFAGGFLWRQGNQARSAPAAQRVAPEPAARLEARRLLDEGMRARYEERWQGAMNALAEARLKDPDIGGVDIVVGEIALEQNDAKTLRHAARQALQRGQNVASAKMLLALEAWMQRGESDAVTAGNSAKQHLVEAAEDQPSNAAAFFFHGELNRLLGQSGEAHRSLRSALHRQTPWQSVSVLGTKLQLAAREAAEAGRNVLAPMPDVQAEAVLELRETINLQSVVHPALARMLAVMPVLQVVTMLEDDALRSGFSSHELADLQRQLRQSLGEEAAGDGASIPRINRASSPPTPSGIP